MRVVAGTAGGRRLQGPTGDRTRPTSDRVREAIFNSLASLDAIEGAAVADIFAGTGACGIEALSRGAADAVFVDSDRKATVVIRSNLEDVGLTKHAEVVMADAFAFLDRGRHFDLVIIDPPYKFDRWSELLSKVNADIVVCESERAVSSPDWTTLKERKHGATHFTILQAKTDLQKKSEADA